MDGAPPGRYPTHSNIHLHKGIATMAKTAADYIAQGAAAFAAGLTRTDHQTSWQARAEYKGWADAKEEARKTELFKEMMAKPPVCAEPVTSHFIAVETEDGKRSYMQVSDNVMKRLQQECQRPSDLRRDRQIDQMMDGYIEAMLWSSGGETDPEDEDIELESLEGFEVADETRQKVLGICARFYDANRTDLAAYADIKKHAPEYGPYQCIGHDLWLTTAGHGAGFWDRGMGRVGKRLSDQCGWNKAFPQQDVYLGDDRLVYLS
jgi:hypothetical protein